MEQHPNREVDLDEVEEGEMVEDKLIIPEEFKNYLNQVADSELGGNNSNATTPSNVNVKANNNANGSEDKQDEQTQMLPARRLNANPENFNQWRNPQAFQMPSPLNQPQSPPLVATPHTPAARTGDMWPCSQYQQQAPPPYPTNYYNQNGQNSSTASAMQCNYNHSYNNAMNYGMMNYGMFFWMEHPSECFLSQSLIAMLARE